MVHKFYFILWLCIFLSFNLSSQDTIQIGEIQCYTSNEYPDKGKQFYGILKYGREDIVFNENHIRTERCYYYDNERNCRGTDYYKMNDSTIYIGDTLNPTPTAWFFKKNSSGKYNVKRITDSIQEYGEVFSILPFLKMGTFTTIYKYEDTLWQETYTEDHYKKPFGQPTLKLHQSIIEEMPFTYTELQTIPMQANGDSINYIDIGYVSLHPCADIRNRSYFCEFLVTKEGKIQNIYTSLVYEDEQKLLTLLLKNMEPVRPGTINNIPVTCKWIAFAGQNKIQLPTTELQEIRETYYLSKKEFRKLHRKNKQRK